MLRKFLSRYVVLFLVFLIASEYSSGQISAFSFGPSQGCAPLMVQFSNFSQNAVSYHWDFGNGNSSTLADPSNVYSTPGTYTVTLTVSGPGGIISSSAQSLQVLAKPVADFNVLQTSGCQNYGVFNFLNLSSQFDSCIWDFGDGTISNVQNPVHSYDIAGTFTVTLVVFNKQFGCSDSKVMSNLVTVFPAPTASINFSDSVSCDLSHPFEFNAQVSNAVAWKWDFGDGNHSNSLPATHAYQDTGYFDISLYLTSSHGCTDSILQAARVHLKWNPVPVINMTEDTGCVPLDLIVYTTPIQGASYDWSLGNGGSKFVSVFYYTYWAAGHFPVQLNITYSNGCQNSSAVKPVSVLPRPSFWFQLLDTNGCAPLQIQLQSQGVTPSSWAWDFGDGSGSNLANPVHSYTTNGQYSVSLTATSPNGCTNTYVSQGKITVYAPVADFQSDVNSGCPPLQVNFTNLSQNAQSYLWDFGDSTISASTDPFHTFTSKGLFPVSLIASDMHGCADTMFMSQPVVVSDIAVNYQMPDTITDCAPYSINLADASGASFYSWDFGDGTTSADPNPYHVFTDPGTYTVSLSTQMSPNGCEYNIPVFQVLQLDAAKPGFTFSASECPPYEVFFIDTSVNASSWSWSFGDGTGSSLKNPSHIYASPDVYNITLEASSPGGCRSSMQVSTGIALAGLSASATVECTDTIPPFNVRFYSNSTGATWWLWIFGDGDSSVAENPVHVYNSAGPFNVSLIIGNDSCQFIYDFPPVSFGSPINTGLDPGSQAVSYEPPVYHCSPHAVSFSNPVQDAVSWTWDFGDGNFSSLASPQHIYSDGGAFLPLLYVTKITGDIDTVRVSDTIFVAGSISDFQISKVNLCSGVLVEVDAGNGIHSCQWEFDTLIINNSTSASHLYPNINATYLISLLLTDSFNCTSHVVKSVNIEATDPVLYSSRRICAGDSIAFSFFNLNFSSYQWDFGDSSFSSSPDAIHSYMHGGYYSVKLIATDTSGCETVFTIKDSVEVVEPVASLSTGRINSSCPGEELKVEFINTSTGASAYQWDFGDSTFSTTISPTHIYNTPGFYDISLIASRAGCSDTVLMDSLVHVTGLVPDFAYTVSSYCVPSVVSFSDSSEDAVSWYWEFGDGGTSTQKNPLYTYIANPKDSIRLTVKNRFGCQKSIRKAAPQLTIADFSTDRRFGCSPFTVTFSDSSLNAIAHEWYFGDNSVSLDDNPAHVYANDGFFNVSLVVTAASGCTDTLTIDSLVEVNTPLARIQFMDTSGCAPLTLTLMDSSINADTWLWDLGNGNTSTNQHPAVIYTDPGFYGIRLIASNKFGCSDTLVLDSIVNVHGALADFTISGDTGCTPFQVDFLNSSVGAVGWYWNFGDGVTDSMMNPIHIYSDTGSFTPSLIVSDSVGCRTVFTWPGQVFVGSQPVISYAIDNLTGCLPLSVQLDDQGTLADSLVWDFGNGSLVSGFLTSYVYDQPGYYNVSLIAYSDFGCTDTMSWSDTIKAFPVPLVDFSTGVVSGCSPLFIKLADLSTSLVEPSYRWSIGDSMFSVLESPEITITQPGLYNVSLQITNGGVCLDSIVRPDLLEVMDSLPPDEVKINRVTVSGNNEILLQWSPLMTGDVEQYIVFRSDSQRLDYDTLAVIQQNSLKGSTTFSYVDAGVDVDSSAYSYKVLAIDECGGYLELDSLNDHQSILLGAMPGLNRVLLSWSAYRGGPIGYYAVYRSDYPGAGYKLIATVDSDLLEFTDTTTWCPLNYLYYVEAVEVGGIVGMDSKSNRIRIQPETDVADQKVDVVRATVVDDDFVLIEWNSPVLHPGLVERYEIYRSQDGMNYHYLADVPAGVHYFEDSEVQVDNIAFKYKIMVRNACDVDTKEGYPGTSILLTEEKTVSGQLLNWTHYQQWENGVEDYVIEVFDPSAGWKEVCRLPPTATEWEVR